MTRSWREAWTVLYVMWQFMLTFLARAAASNLVQAIPMAAAVLLISSCERCADGGSAPPVVTQSTPAASSTAVTAKPVNPFEDLESQQLLTLPSSAYNATVSIDDDAIYVLTASAAHRVVPGEAPRAFPLDLGYGWAVTRTAFLYWSKGAIWKAAKTDGKSTRVAKLEARPQFFVSSGDDFAWIENVENERYSIGSLDGTKPRTIYVSSGRIDAATMLHDWVFFVERPDDAGWRIGAVRASGGAPTFTSNKPGRPPAMLAAWRDLYYYDGNSREVRRLSPDLRQEEVLSKELVCSPLTVYDRVYCSSVEGLSAISLEQRSAVPILDNIRGSTTQIAANSKRLVWLNDIAADQLALRMLELPSQ